MVLPGIPSNEIFSSQWIIDLNNLTGFYIAGEFNSWFWNSEEYKLIQNGDFYEITLSNVLSGQEYKFVPIDSNGIPYEGWIPDVVNYRIENDGWGGYNSITP